MNAKVVQRQSSTPMLCQFLEGYPMAPYQPTTTPKDISKGPASQQYLHITTCRVHCLVPPVAGRCPGNLLDT